MADIHYYVDDYIEQGYYVYTAEAAIGLGDYLEENYLAVDYFQRTGTYFTLTADLVRATYIEGQANLSCAFTQTIDTQRFRGFDVALVSTATMSAGVQKFVGVSSALTSSCSMDVTAGVDRRTSVTLSTQADLNAQAARSAGLNSNLDTAFTQTTTATKTTTTQLDLLGQFAQTTTALRTAPASADFTATATQSTQAVKTATVTPAFDSIASQLTVAYKNATGTILMEPRATLSAVIGVIKQFEHNFITGVASYDISLTDPSITISSWNNLVVSIWTARTEVDALGQAPIWSTPIITSAGGLPAYIRRLEYNDTSAIRFVSVITGTPTYWTWANAFPNDTDWHNIVLVYRGAGTGDYKKFELFVDGVSKGVAQAYYGGEQTLWTGVDGGNYPGLRLGTTTYGNGESDRGDAAYVGDFAQLWVGKDPNFSIVDFYDQGVVDLGTDGTAYGNLPSPEIYNELDSLSNTVYQIPASTRLSRPDMVGRFSVSAEPVSVLENTVYALGEFTLAATVIRVQVTAAALSSSSTLVCDAVKTTVITTDLAATASLAIDYNRYRDTAAAFASSSTLTAVNVRLRYFDTSLLTAATLTAAINETTELAADLVANAVLDITYTRPRYVSSDLTSQATLTFDPQDRLRDQSAALTAAATLTADGINLEGTRVPMSAAATLTCSAEKRIVSGADLTSAATMNAQAFRVAFGSAHLPAIAVTLTVADIINFDPFLTITVPAESRSIKVLAESRNFALEQETRAIKVRSETRELLVPESTQTKLTQGTP